MARRDELIAFLDDLLEVDGFDDYGPNGLQVEGGDEVDRVVTGVSANRDLFERAAAEGAGMVVCHHGLFWGDAPAIVDARLRGRLEALFAAGMTLAAYHLPLDAHPAVGNNALICDELGLDRRGRFAAVKGRPIGFVGEAVEPLALEALAERCCSTFGRDPLVLEGDGRELRRVGVVSGGGGSSHVEAVAVGCDAFITGEPEEPAMADARESGVAYLACGHYATETLGVKRVGELLAERFGVGQSFVEVQNPV